MNLFGVQSHLYKKDWWRLHCIVFSLPSRAGNRYDNYFLGRPWIHRAGVVPSTLHQKVKFVVEESLITMVTEEDMIATTIVTAPYLEIKEDATECSFRSFEIAITTKKESKALMSHLSQNTQMILRQTISK